jgi:hypothetical protein
MSRYTRGKDKDIIVTSRPVFILPSAEKEELSTGVEGVLSCSVHSRVPSGNPLHYISNATKCLFLLKLIHNCLLLLLFFVFFQVNLSLT